MTYSTRILWEPLRVIAASTLSGSYQALGAVLAHPAYILKLVNNSTSLVTISINGTSDIDVAPPDSFWLYDEGKVGLSSNIPAVAKGTQIYVKGDAGTGSIYLVSQYIVPGI